MTCTRFCYTHQIYARQFVGMVGDLFRSEPGNVSYSRAYIMCLPCLINVHTSYSNFYYISSYLLYYRLSRRVILNFLFLNFTTLFHSFIFYLSVIQQTIRLLRMKGCTIMVYFVTVQNTVFKGCFFVIYFFRID